MRGVVGADLPFEEHVVRAWRRGDIFRVRGILHVAARRHGGVEGDELDARLLTSVQRRVDRHRVNGADMKHLQASLQKASSQQAHPEFEPNEQMYAAKALQPPASVMEKHREALLDGQLASSFQVPHRPTDTVRFRKLP